MYSDCIQSWIENKNPPCWNWVNQQRWRWIWIFYWPGKCQSNDHFEFHLRRGKEDNKRNVHVFWMRQTTWKVHVISMRKLNRKPKSNSKSSSKRKLNRNSKRKSEVKDGSWKESWSGSKRIFKESKKIQKSNRLPYSINLNNRLLIESWKRISKHLNRILKNPRNWWIFWNDCADDVTG